MCIYCMSYLTKSKKVQFCSSLHILRDTFNLCLTNRCKYQQVSLMIRQKILVICKRLYKFIVTFSDLVIYTIRSINRRLGTSLRYVYAIMLENLAGCRTMFLFAVSCKIDALERNTY